MGLNSIVILTCDNPDCGFTEEVTEGDILPDGWVSLAGEIIRLEEQYEKGYKIGRDWGDGVVHFHTMRCFIKRLQRLEELAVKTKEEIKEEELA